MLRTGSIVGAIIAIAALITISKRMANLEFVWLIETFLRGYQTVIALVFDAVFDWWVPQFLAAVFSFLGWRFELFPQWRDLLALLLLYLSSHVKEALAENVPNSALALTARCIAGLIGSLLSVVGASIAFAAEFSQVLILFAGCLLGIITYRLGFAAQFAFDHRRDGFGLHFKNKAGGAVIVLLGGTAISFAWAITYTIIGPSSIIVNLQVVFLFMFIFFLSLYHLFVSVYSEWCTGERFDSEARQRILATGHYNIGIRVLVVWAGAGIVILIEGVT